MEIPVFMSTRGKCIRQVEIQGNQSPEVFTNQLYRYRLRLHTRMRTFKTVTVSHPPPACKILLSMLRFCNPRSLSRSSCFCDELLTPPPRRYFASVIIEHAALCFLHFCLCIYKQKKNCSIKSDRRKPPSER